VLAIQDLTVAFRTEDGELRAVDGIDLAISPGEKLGIVGESGCGKSTVAMSIMRLLPTARLPKGDILFEGRSLLGLREGQMRRVRGREIAMIFQDAMTALHPMLPVGTQIEEILEAHETLPRGEARRRAIDLLRQVGIAAPELRIDAYPHELSGGMCQRVMIAIAIACHPKLIIADEPTTALDVTVQAQILELIDEVCRRSGTAVLLITHDLGVVAGMTDRVAVMYAGKVVETAPTETLFERPVHPYTQGLLRSVPLLDEGIGTDLPTIPGSVDVTARGEGCKFAPRCDHAQSICREQTPPLESVEPGHAAACWFKATLAERAGAERAVGGTA
jgi:oligopeptide/dipeptide ABC transporter ATP-binding protein